MLAEYEKSLKTIVNTVVFEGFSYVGPLAISSKIDQKSSQKVIKNCYKIWIKTCFKNYSKIDEKSTKNHQKSAKIVNFELKMSQVEPKMAKHGNKMGLVEHLEATWRQLGGTKMSKNGTVHIGYAAAML